MEVARRAKPFREVLPLIEKETNNTTEEALSRSQFKFHIDNLAEIHLR
jgi:hypothetical protein